MRYYTHQNGLRMNKLNDDLLKPIAIINRQDGSVERLLTTKKQAISMYSIFVKMPEVARAIEVFADFSGQTQKELLKDFNLVELVNTFSTRYMAKTLKKTTRKIEVKDENKTIRFKI